MHPDNTQAGREHGRRCGHRLEPRWAAAGRCRGLARCSAGHRSKPWPDASRCLSMEGCAAEPTSSRRWRWARPGMPHRPRQLWALSVAGEDGVAHPARRLFRREIDRVMGLCGLRNLDEVGSDLLIRRDNPAKTKPIFSRAQTFVIDDPPLLQVRRSFARPTCAQIEAFYGLRPASSWTP